MEEKNKVRLVNIIVIIIDLLLLGVICGNHCSVPDQVLVQKESDRNSQTLKVAMFDN